LTDLLNEEEFKKQYTQNGGSDLTCKQRWCGTSNPVELVEVLEEMVGNWKALGKIMLSVSLERMDELSTTGKKSFEHLQGFLESESYDLYRGALDALLPLSRACERFSSQGVTVFEGLQIFWGAISPFLEGSNVSEHTKLLVRKK
ncbi:hypothetical protein FOZ63_017593, partial [Perkinsus olseni]